MSAAASDLTRVVGLAYEPGEGLPHIVLKGAGPLADEVLERGRRIGAPVVHDRELLDRLFRLPTDSEIGPELFRVVAVILAHVFALNEKRKEAPHG
ncbi:MAG TPA: EscU/YscU/HrcU family type III secretion system export apparatus switch protein [Burkholderiales bacterium]|nr:EscU/YscU/HrcU family type III secretion system export apparatus switch protein [Burkholderiales bacterium]